MRKYEKIRLRPINYQIKPAISYRLVTLHFETTYSGLSRSNFKDHYGDTLQNNVWV